MRKEIFVYIAAGVFILAGLFVLDCRNRQTLSDIDKSFDNAVASIRADFAGIAEDIGTMDASIKGIEIGISSYGTGYFEGNERIREILASYGAGLDARINQYEKQIGGNTSEN